MLLPDPLLNGRPIEEKLALGWFKVMDTLLKGAFGYQVISRTCKV